MPTLSRWFIKAGMIYFVMGLILASILLAQPVMGWSGKLQAFRPVYLHFLFVGWVTQIIMGVGYWMFPKYSKDNPRFSDELGWMTFALLNIGLLLRAIGEPTMAISPQSGWGWTLAASALCMTLTAIGFIVNTWPRIKEK